MTYHSIPTTYRGVRFRSRLEARWAAFMDLMNWPWQYEPFDLKGYIPDFVIQWPQPLLVEVKPFVFTDGELLKSQAARIRQSGWTNEAVFVDSGLHDEMRDGVEYDGYGPPNDLAWAIGKLYMPAPAGEGRAEWAWLGGVCGWSCQFTINGELTWHCRRCGRGHGDERIGWWEHGPTAAQLEEKARLLGRSRFTVDWDGQPNGTDERVYARAANRSLNQWQRQVRASVAELWAAAGNEVQWRPPPA